MSGVHLGGIPPHRKVPLHLLVKNENGILQAISDPEYTIIFADGVVLTGPSALTPAGTGEALGEFQIPSTYDPGGGPINIKTRIMQGCIVKYTFKRGGGTVVRTAESDTFWISLEDHIYRSVDDAAAIAQP